MTEAYDATKDPRTGRPFSVQSKENGELGQAVQETRRQHHQEGIPRLEEPMGQFFDESPNSKPAAMKAPPEDWEADDVAEDNEGEETSSDEEAEAHELKSAEEVGDARPRAYQVNVENPSIAVRDYELEASGTVTIEEYRGDDLWARISVEVTTTPDPTLSMAEANPVLLDASLKTLKEVCDLDPEILRRALVT